MFVTRIQRFALSFLAATALSVGQARADNTSVPRPEGLTDLTSPNGAVVADKDLLNGMSPQKAFNDSSSLTDGSNRCITQNQKSLTLVYTFDTKTLVNAIGIQNFNNGDCQTRSPKAWTFWGSDDFDGTRAGIATATWEEIKDAARTSETGWAKPEYRFYQFSNVKSYKSYKIAFTDTNGNGYLQFQKLEYFCVLQRAVRIHGDPAPCGDFSYDTIMPEAGSTVVLSAFDGAWTNAEKNTSAVCLGYEAVMADTESGTNIVVAAGTGTTCSFTMPDAMVDLTWKFERSFKVTVSAGDHGTVVGPASWVREGSVVDPTVTPETGYGFFKWDTTDASLCRFDTAFYAKKPISVTAVFAPVQTLEPGTDVLAPAVAAAGTGNLILRLAAGTYTETNLASCVKVTTPIRIEGAGSAPADVVVTRKNQSARILYLDHADAVVRNVTISGGWGQGNTAPIEGGNIYITANGGTIMDAVVTGGSVNTYNSCGGNIRMLGGHVLRCVVANGWSQVGYGAQGGGGICATGASLIENCLVKGNKCGAKSSNAATAAAGLRIGGTSKAVNCTIVENGSTTPAWGGVYASDSAQVVNCAIFNNIACSDPSGSNQTWGGVASAFISCHADVLINAACFQTDTPAFADASNGDYTLSVSSPLRDRGANYLKTAACSSADLSGAGRLSGTSVDVGAYEYVSSGLSCDFTADSDGGLTPCPVTFTATVEGASGVVTYMWDFDGDGIDDETTTEPVCSHIYEVGGVYSVSLKVEVGGQAAEASHANMIKTCQKALYVSTNGAGIFPYVSLQEAATNIADAVEAAVDGCEIFIAPGEYAHKEQIFVNKAVRIVGLGDSPEDVRVRSSSARAFAVDNADAFIANLDMKGSHSVSGKTLLIENSGGAVSNCIIRVGGGVSGWGGGGSAVYGTKAFVTHCRITGSGLSNLGDGPTRGGAVHLASKSRIENSLIQDCAIAYTLGNATNGGSTMTLNGGSVAVNCTVVNCTNSTTGAGGVYLDGNSFATNCVVYDVRNASGDGSRTWLAGTLANFVHCAATNVTSAAFRDYANGDYRPAMDGALYNGGAAVANPPATDLAGRPRVIGGKIDIGCYEGKMCGLIIMIK